ncbi:PREDICTED: probable leucine-rich repeat receptor kinase At1g35710 [Prunus dulcis]|uniref:PREDICTED: probable leucine-rich repeat receptor kinase At1g35710 n=1 Tax=Prunus dulcis TaxID=3755 RepID=A0A5E4FMB6_PRUDU|nr:hypothetical protein L3X38_018984 [Prunus dulcis]VVA28600.1 PREDICTED: probable leucine-rich repeat receptor kinase At1g35710 [Prunus dulcis]
MQTGQIVAVKKLHTLQEGGITIALDTPLRDVLDRRLSPPRDQVAEKVVVLVVKLAFSCLQFAKQTTISANHATTSLRGAINSKDIFTTHN